MTEAFACKKCTYVATKKYVLDTHMSKNHPTDEGLKCSACNKYYVNKEGQDNP